MAEEAKAKIKVVDMTKEQEAEQDKLLEEIIRDAAPGGSLDQESASVSSGSGSYVNQLTGMDARNRVKALEKEVKSIGSEGSNFRRILNFLKRITPEEFMRRYSEQANDFVRAFDAEYLRVYGVLNSFSERNITASITYLCEKRKCAAFQNMSNKRTQAIETLTSLLKRFDEIDQERKEGYMDEYCPEIRSRKGLTREEKNTELYFAIAKRTQELKRTKMKDRLEVRNYRSVLRRLSKCKSFYESHMAVLDVCLKKADMLFQPFRDYIDELSATVETDLTDYGHLIEIAKECNDNLKKTEKDRSIYHDWNSARRQAMIEELGESGLKLKHPDVREDYLNPEEVEREYAKFEDEQDECISRMDELLKIK